MTHSTSMRGFRAGTAGCVLLGLLAACGGDSGGDSFDAGAPGETVGKPGATPELGDGDDFYIVDPNEGGDGDALEIVSSAWGRLVDVADTVPDATQPSGFVSRTIYRDFVVGPTVGTAANAATDPNETAVLTVNPITGQPILRIKAEFGAAGSDFDSILLAAADGLETVDPTSLDPSELPPFPVVRRNAALVLQFNDLLDEDTIQAQESVKVLVGTPPTVPYDARILPDNNRGGVGFDGSFHSTRVVVDFTISELELATIPQVVQVNGIGLPPSPSIGAANVVVRVPALEAPTLGQFTVLKNLDGKAIDPFLNEAADFGSATFDVVRAFRSANAADVGGAFLTDSIDPQIIGIQGVTVDGIAFGANAREYLLDLTFDDAACTLDPVAGDTLEFPAFRLQVDTAATAVGASVTGIEVSLTADFDLALLDEQSELDSLLGTTSQFFTPWRDGLDEALAPCFIRFSPSATGGGAATGVDPDADILIRFSEAMLPASLDPFQNFFIGRRAGIDTLSAVSPNDGAAGPEIPEINELVLGDVAAAPNGRDFRFRPILPLTHENGTAETYYLNLLSSLGSGVVDLAGNSLDRTLPEIEFAIEADAASANTGGWALRFNSLDEAFPTGQDITGQFIYNQNGGFIQPRAVGRFSVVIDNSQLLPAGNTAFPNPNMASAVGLAEPLISQGSRLHHMWRAIDAGLDTTQTDDSLYNLDVEFLALAPVAGVANTVLPEFEIYAGHSEHLFDESFDNMLNVPIFPNSGFKGTDNFAANYIDTPTLIHPRDRGLAISSADVFQTGTTQFVRLPLNQDVPEDERLYFTWRDTAKVERGALDDADVLDVIGTPSFIDFVVPLEDVFMVGARLPGDTYSFSVASDGERNTVPGVPTVGLPILLEYRTFPTEQANINLFDGGLVVPAGLQPFTRAHSTGGTNLGGQVVQKNPDLEVTPDGGFVSNPPPGSMNPPASPPGTPTPPRDPSFYNGQLDVVMRVSRVFTAVIDSENRPGQQVGTPAPGFIETTYEPDYAQPVLIPPASEQPEGTQVVLAFRGTDRDRILNGVNDILNATNLDVYGDVAAGPVTTVDADGFIIPLDSVAELFDFDGPGESGSSEWVDNVNGVDGLRFVQTRITFIGNAATGLTAVLSAYGLAFDRGQP
ncbi:MAG: Ig-like domain-containing protein [Planctomycetota bacterium]